MASRIRPCIECPKCHTRYLVGFSPYPNGSYLVTVAFGAWEEWTLYCSCSWPHSASRWRGPELRAYEVSSTAHIQGYGSSDEIIAIPQNQSEGNGASPLRRREPSL